MVENIALSASSTTSSLSKTATSSQSDDMPDKMSPDKENSVAPDDVITNGASLENGTSSSPAEDDKDGDAEALSPAQQKSKIDSLCLQHTLVVGDKWYLVSCTWMRAFKRYCDSYEEEHSNSVFKGTHPGPINNSDILYDDGRTLKSSLLENVDFDLVPEKCWQLLLKWYGLVQPAPRFAEEAPSTKESEITEKLNITLESDPGSQLGEIRRFVIQEGCYIKYLKIEIYYLELSVYKYPDTRISQKLKMSKSNTVDQLRAKLREVYGIAESKNVRVYGVFGSEMHEIAKMSSTLQDEGIYSNQQIAIEVQNEDGSWPKKAASSSINAFSSPSSTSSSSKFFSTPSTYSSLTTNANVPGLCGLSNLGNTCFMNSALQCMSNVVALTEYFRNNYHKAEINTENPLGMRGEIAREYGELIQSIWSGNYSSIPPRSFKSKVGMFAPRFSGFQQHDSQELLSFLLDGLHEDLNRVKKKPYIEVEDSDNRDDDILAREAWENHLKRNDSVIVDLFHGLFKSTLVCPDCSKVSVTFDPYCFLSLPLPVKKQKAYEVTYFKLNLEKPPTKYRVIVPDGCTVFEFQTALAKLIGGTAKPEDMITTQVFNSRIHKTLPHEDTMGSMYGRDEYSVFETPTDFNKATVSFRFVPLLFREKNSPKTMMSSYTCFGTPLFVMVPKGDITYDELYTIIMNRIKPFLEKEENLDPKAIDDLKLDDANGDNASSTAGKLQNGIFSSSESGAASSIGDEVENFDENGVVKNGIKSESGDCTTDNMSVCESEKEEPRSPKYYFRISAVYGTGSTEIQQLHRQGKFVLNPQAYLTCDWTHDARKVLFKPTGELIIPHPSLDEKVELKKTIKLEDCINQFLCAEKLGPMDSWYCPKCKDLKQAMKKFDLWTLPHILVIHLKRFSYNRFFRDKLDNKIDFPLKQLELNKFVTNANVGHQVYDLIGVVNHYGGLGGGHYTAYCKHEPSGNWHDYDDTRVSVLPGQEDSVQTSAAYVLFYMRRERTPMQIVPPSLNPQPNSDAVESSVDDEQMDTN